MCQPDSDLSNEEWTIKQIKAAQSRERLDYIGEVIKYDTWEDEPYTKDPDMMAELRTAWTKRAEEIERNG